MTTLIWGAPGDRAYEAGVDRGVFYPLIGPGVAWNGLMSVNENESDTDQTFIYIDGERVRSRVTIGSFSAELSAFTYPIEFDGYSGPFNLSYRTGVADDLTSVGQRYKLHLVYNAVASPSQQTYASLNEQPSTAAFSWSISTTPVPIEYARASAHLIIDSGLVDSGIMQVLEDLLYGGPTTQPAFPTVQEVLDIFEVRAKFRIIDHGDGSFTATGPDDAVFMNDATTFTLSWPSVVLLSEDTYQASSY